MCVTGEIIFMALFGVGKSHISDIVDGPPLYKEKGHDKNGLMRYKCSRGTSSVEGSVHMNIIRKFASYNAGPRLTDMVLSDYRLYHNIDFAVLWSDQCSEDNSIVYKTPEQLKAHFNILEDRKKYGESVRMNFETVRAVRRVAQDESRFSTSILALPNPAFVPKIYSQPLPLVNDYNRALRPLAPAMSPLSLIHSLSAGENLDNDSKEAKKPRKARTCKLCEDDECPG
ncbi:hypothetical protein K501DRAFT_277629 [Backusella circina FSU 941]|nr:hypothetical protein K501DRAFT_277629 [Backusella circina FSU 941]